MDKPIPEAVRAIMDVLFRVYMNHDDFKVTSTLLHDMAVAVSTLTAAQQQGQAVAWMTPEAIAHLAKQNGPAKVDAWNCASGGARVPVYSQPMQQGGGEVCEACDGAGHVVTYADPYDRGDVSSPEQSPCHACTAPPSAPVEVEGLYDEVTPAVAYIRFGDEDAPEWDGQRVRVSLAQQPAAVDEARPLDDWHEDDGPVVWWKLPVDEPAWIGTPLDSDWPGYHTHWTPHPAAPAAQHQEPTT